MEAPSVPRRWSPITTRPQGGIRSQGGPAKLGRPVGGVQPVVVLDGLLHSRGRCRWPADRVNPAGQRGGHQTGHGARGGVHDLGPGHVQPVGLLDCPDQGAVLGTATHLHGVDLLRAEGPLGAGGADPRPVVVEDLDEGVVVREGGDLDPLTHEVVVGAVEADVVDAAVLHAVRVGSLGHLGQEEGESHVGHRHLVERGGVAGPLQQRRATAVGPVRTLEVVVVDALAEVLPEPVLVRQLRQIALEDVPVRVRPRALAVAR